MDNVVQNAGFIIFKDRNLVILFSNDLVSTQRREVEGKREETVSIVNGYAVSER